VSLIDGQDLASRDVGAIGFGLRPPSVPQWKRRFQLLDQKLGRRKTMREYLVEKIVLPDGQILNWYCVAESEQAAIAKHKARGALGGQPKRSFGETKCTVYFCYRFFPDTPLHFGHTDVVTTDLQTAVDIVMAQERASMCGHVGDQGKVEFVYATNNLDPNNMDKNVGLYVWMHAIPGGKMICFSSGNQKPINDE
jgi:hypothetical protein